MSTLLFATACQVVVDQDLIAPAPDLAERRSAFRGELRDILRDSNYVGRIARNQFVAREAKARQERLDVGSPRSAPIPWLYDGRPSALVGHTPRALVWPLLIGVALLAGCTAAGIGALSLADALTATGLPDPGPATTLGLPFVRAAGEIAAVLAVGSFLFAAFLVPPQRSGVLDADGYRALRLGTVASGVWAVCAALLVPLTISDVSGQPLGDHLNPVRIWSVAGLVTTASAWRWTAALAALVTLASSVGAALVVDAAAAAPARC